MLCRSCRASNPPSAVRCRKCGQRLPRRPGSEEDDEDDDYDDDDEDDVDEVVSSIVPYKNAQALVAYYCGIFGLIPGLGLILGPTAAVMGFLGARYARENPRAKGQGHAVAGIVLGMVETLLNWGILVALLIVFFANK
jgi:F0F1-type ATP synthase membrane subunit c/vacuolar-type H+-ATPase subunit K